MANILELPESLQDFFDYEQQCIRPSRYKVAYGGRCGCKSESFGRLLIGRCLQRRTRWLCAREFQASIRESVHQLLSNLINEHGLGYKFDIQRDKILGPHGSEIVYIGLHDKSLDNLKSYVGFDGCWGEEAQSFSRRSLQYLDPTIRKSGSEIWFSFNPENEDDPIYQDFVVNTPKNAIVRCTNWYNNPWLNQEMRDTLDRDYDRDKDAADWIWGGNLRTISDKQVLRGKCITLPFKPTDLWDGPYYGLDFGYGADPMAAVRVWIWQGDLYVEYEAFASHCEIEQHPAQLDTIPDSRKNVIRADCSRPEMVSYLKRNGFPRAVSCIKWPGCVEDRVTFLRSFNRIVIHPRCPEIATEGKLWAWKTDKAGCLIQPPVLLSGHDHGWDAVGYALEPFIRGSVDKAKRRGTQIEPRNLGLSSRPNPQGWMG